MSKKYSTQSATTFYSNSLYSNVRNYFVAESTGMQVKRTESGLLNIYTFKFRVPPVIKPS